MCVPRILSPQPSPVGPVVAIQVQGFEFRMLRVSDSGVASRIVAFMLATKATSKSAYQGMRPLLHDMRNDTMKSFADTSFLMPPTATTKNKHFPEAILL